MRRQLLTATILLISLTVLLGLAYPLAITAVAQLAFNEQANGSIIEVDGTAVASELVGQRFTGDQWFHPRPSSAGPDGYDATDSGGSNLGPTSPVLADLVERRIADYRRVNGLPTAIPVPVDAVTASASGLDPHISPANARLQAPRVARARDVDLAVVLDLVDRHTEHRPLGVLGDHGVHVVRLNLALDQDRPR
jgi:potassium-transporting ATPase KdpC subunit